MFLNFIAFFFMVALLVRRAMWLLIQPPLCLTRDLVSFIPLIGIETSVTSLVGRYMGAGRPQVAHRAALSGIKTWHYLFGCYPDVIHVYSQTLVLVFQPDVPSDIFNSEVPTAVSMIRIASLYVLLEAVMIALVGALRGVGDTHYTMLVSIIAIGHLCLFYICA